jgi:uncharacterized membrane-anchored protein YitT (DUF2179 family)
MNFNKTNIKNNLIEILGTILGSAIMAAGTSFFLLPNQLSSGGFSGLATITYYLLNIPMGTMILVLNIPLFILAIYKIGKNFFIKALIGTVSLSIFIDLFDKFNPLTEDRFLACIYGGIIIGIGTAVILKSKSSTGGTDLVSNIIREYNPRIRMGTVIVIIDTIIIALNVIFFKEVEIGLYSAITIYLDGKMIDIIFEGIYFTKLFFIISDKNEEIANVIEKEIKRGVTGLYGKGMYAKKNKLILICAAPRGNVAKIKELAQKIDPNCFIILSNAREVFGEGFKKE